MFVILEKGGTLDEHEFRTMVLNSIRRNVKRFKGDYGKDVIIACDTIYSWRKAFFTHYKSNRKKLRDESDVDWEKIFVYFKNVKEELKEYTNYKVIDVPEAEADDVISYFTKTYGVEIGKGEIPIVIVSGDKDFIQLQKYTNVSQFDPITDKRIQRDNPALYLIDHIIRGDKGDGVPNILSDGDTFVSGKRQVTLTKKRYDALFEAIRYGECDAPNYMRNRMLIDLDYTPPHIHEKIKIEYEKESSKGKKSLMAYFAKYRLSALIESLGDF